jgi:hypothetical protein
VEAEASVVVGKLDGREAEVEDDAIERSEPALAGDVVEKGEVASRKDGAITEARELSRGDGDGRGVAIEPEDLSVGRARVEDGRGMAASADGSVEIATASTRIKLGE